jgi:hypothetical protein
VTSILIFCVTRITWRWPLVWAETRHDRREHRINFYQLLQTKVLSCSLAIEIFVLTMQHPLCTKVGTDFADKRRLLGPRSFFLFTALNERVIWFTFVTFHTTPKEYTKSHNEICEWDICHTLWNLGYIIQTEDILNFHLYNFVCSLSKWNLFKMRKSLLSRYVCSAQ